MQGDEEDVMRLVELDQGEARQGAAASREGPFGLLATEFGEALFAGL